MISSAPWKPDLETRRRRNFRKPCGRCTASRSSASTTRYPEGKLMEQFASGWKRNYYGKGDVTVYRLNRDGKSPAGGSPVFGANVLMLLYGDAFWPTYTTGDNTGLVATDSMKNFIQRETLNFPGSDLEAYCRFLGEKFLGLYPQAEGAQLTATEIPYQNHGVTFTPTGPDQAYARLEMTSRGILS